jgi:hypothetical protein
MGFRFRRSVRLFPGLRINLSKSAPSISVGAPGHMVNIGEQGTRATIGAPGTGVSYRTPTSRGRGGFWILLIVVLVIIVFAFK